MVLFFTVNRIFCFTLHWLLNKHWQCSASMILPYEWDTFQGVFQKHFAPWSSGAVEAMPLQWGPFCSFHMNLSATFMELENTVCSGVSCCTSGGHAIGRAISHTGLSSSWDDAFARGFSSAWLCFWGPETWVGLTCEVMKKEAVTLMRIWLGELWA